MKKETTPLTILPKNVKHCFTAEERVKLSDDLVVALDAKTNAEAEFDSVKATYKAKITEAESRVGTLASSLRAGFDMRVKDCILEFRPEDRQKDYFLAVPKDGKTSELTKGDLALTEPMTPGDFQQELIAADSVYEKRASITLFPSVGDDYGLIVVGELSGKWYAAGRVKIGSKVLEERLNAEQRSFKQRYDAIVNAAKRVSKWAGEQLKSDAKGFEAPIKAAVEAEKERVE